MEKLKEDNKILYLGLGKGKFVYSHGDDAKILNYLCGYKLAKRYIVGFPSSILDKIVGILENNKISYKVIKKSSGEIIKSHDFKNLSKYDYFLEHALKNIEEKDLCNDILKLLEDCDEEKLKEIMLEIKKCMM